ncbi:hypothetical protein [Rhodocytophaga rosea]|nr:hypothetical protein [Rhodocytophaga rosea]
MSDHSEESSNELPPFLNTWKKIYLAVLANLLLLILLFYWFTQYFQ